MNGLQEYIERKRTGQKSFSPQYAAQQNSTPIQTSIGPTPTTTFQPVEPIQPPTPPAEMTFQPIEPPPKTKQLPTRQHPDANQHQNKQNQRRKNSGPDSKDDIGHHPPPSDATPISAPSQEMPIGEVIHYICGACAGIVLIFTGGVIIADHSYWVTESNFALMGITIGTYLLTGLIPAFIQITKKQPQSPRPQSSQEEVSRMTDSIQEFVTPWKAFIYFWTRWTLQGRASRSEFWGAHLMNFVAGTVLGIFLGILQGVMLYLFSPMSIILGLNFHVIVYVLTSIISIVPNFAITVRRLHDTNHSGWFYLFNFIPIVGPIFVLILLLSRSNTFTNDYGPVPNLRKATYSGK